MDLKTIDDREQSTRQQIISTVLFSVEKFRFDAEKAFDDFRLRERMLLNSLESKGISSYGLLSAWYEELLPMQNTIKSKRTDDIFTKSLIDNLLMSPDEAGSEINRIVARRESDVLHDFIYRIYPIADDRKKDLYKNQRKIALKLLSRQESEINQIRNHRINYVLYKEIAKQNNVTVIDSQSSLLKRLWAKISINSERKKTIELEKKRLLQINSRLKVLSTIDGGLVAEIFENKIDLMIILGLRNQYEKKVGKLPKANSKNAVKHLEIFDAETQKYKKDQIEKLTINSDQVSLESTRKITEYIDNLLLRIFDLTNIQKNKLLLYTKEYRELMQEKDSIIDIQNNRYDHIR